jgi:hypothetical protein
MVKHLCGSGLGVNLIKLNGRLELRFAADALHTVHYTIHGADTDDTTPMEHAREAAYGQPVMSLGLEMYLEEVNGILELTFQGSVGSTLAFKYDGRQAGGMLGLGDDIEMDPDERRAVNLVHGVHDAGEMVGSAKASTHPQKEVGTVRNATRDAQVQTLSPPMRNARTQTLKPLITHVGIQTRVRRTVSIGVQVAADQEMNQLAPDIVYFTEPNSAATNGKRHGDIEEGTHTFTSAVATVFQSFNEPRDPYRVKRQAKPAAEYRAYKHIFIEGYRNENDKDEEGRLHIDLSHHVLI